MGVLKYDAHGAPQIRACPPGHFVDAVAIDVNRPTTGRLEPADELEQRRLAGARRARDKYEFARLDAKIDIGQEHPTAPIRPEEHTSELQQLMSISNHVYSLKKK